MCYANLEASSGSRAIRVLTNNQRGEVWDLVASTEALNSINTEYTQRNFKVQYHVHRFGLDKARYIVWS